MIFENITTFSIALSILLIIFVIYFFWIYIRSNNKITSLIFLSISILFVIFSLFSPRFGNYDKNITQKGGNILFIMDVSKSMNVFDISYDNNIVSRLQAQKLMIYNYVKNNIGNSYSLFAFAGETVELLPFTNDIGLFQTILNGVDQKNISKYGSDFEGLFQIVSNYVESEENAGTIVIFTDGGEIEKLSLTQSLTDKINKYKTQIIIIGVGSSKGGYIIDGTDLFGRPMYKIYNGEKVLSKINSSGITKISDKYKFNNGFLLTQKDIPKIEDIINSLVIKQEFKKNISLSRDISYIFITMFLLFFSLFLIIENKKPK